MGLAMMSSVRLVVCLETSVEKHLKKNRESQPFLSALWKHGSHLSRVGTVSWRLGCRPTANVCTALGGFGFDWGNCVCLGPLGAFKNIK